MYECMHACMHVCMYVFMNVCMNVCMYVCMHVCMYVRISINVTFAAILRLSRDHEVASGGFGGRVAAGENHCLTPNHWQPTHMSWPR